MTRRTQNFALHQVPAPPAATNRARTAVPAVPVVSPDVLRQEILSAWDFCRQAVAQDDKSAVRQLHLQAKYEDRTVGYGRLLSDFTKLRRYFPSAAAIEPGRIDPVLVPVHQRTVEERLFKIVRGFWSMPYSKGYGRRLRFLVMDQYHEAVIGIIGLQSPSADLACRDDYLGVPKDRKLQVVNNTLDAYTIGATPVYAPLLAGKLVAGMLHAPQVRQEYWRTYGGRRTTQRNERIPQPLLAVTTASAFGRSSIYNRLRFGERVLAKPLGYTKGFGTFHLEEVYPKLVAWLKQTGRCVPAGFGNGPKVRWQNIMRGLVDLGISRDCLEHGLLREVFIFEFVENLQNVCLHGATPNSCDLDVGSWGEYWKERWCLPRVRRMPDWYEFDANGILQASLQAPLYHRSAS